MPSDVVIQVESVAKQYRLGQIGGTTLREDLQRWWARVRQQPDPTLKVTEANVRDRKAEARSRKSEVGGRTSGIPNVGGALRRGELPASPPSGFPSPPPPDLRPPPSGSASPLSPPTSDRRPPTSSPPADFVWALKDVSFEVKRGEVLGIIGRNGAGKSTLLKILSRITAPTSGQIKVKGRIASLLEVGTGMHPELTGRENIYLNGAILGMTKAEITGKLDEIIAFSGVERYIDTPVKRYSSGMMVRLGFAVAAHLEPEILIVDEVLAVGDAEFQKKCIGKMQDVAGHGRTVLFVSHNITAVRALCPGALWLSDGCIRRIGACDEVASAYERSSSPALEGAPSRQAGFLFEGNATDASGAFAVTAVQMLDDAGAPKTDVATWDYVCFRIFCRAGQSLAHGSAVLDVRDTQNVRLLLCSTEPDSHVPWRIEVGSSYVDCVFPRWPLAAGEYVACAALAVPGVHYLTPSEPLFSLRVSGRNVFGSTNLVPKADRYLVAAEHYWRLPT